MTFPDNFYYKKDRLNQIRGFCTTVQLGSVNKAAQKLNLEPATVSKQIISLERDMKLQLFYRNNTKKLVLNNSGEEFYKKAIVLLQGVEGLFNHFHDDLKLKNSSEINIAGSNTVISQLLPNYIQEFQKHNSDIKFNIYNIPFQETKDKILSEEVDIGIWTFEELPSEFDVQELYSFKPVIIMHKDNILSQKKDRDITFNDLQEENIIMMDKYNFMEPLLNVVKMHNIEGRIKFINGNWESIRYYVKLNLGIHIYSEIYSKFGKCIDEDIVSKDIGHLFPETKYKIITKNGRVLNDNLRHFLEIIYKYK